MAKSNADALLARWVQPDSPIEGPRITVNGACECGGMRRERRRHIRVPGPFAGWHMGVPSAPVRIMDLSEGGCFIDSLEAPPSIGHRLVLKIDFPGDASLTLEGETLYVRP